MGCINLSVRLSWMPTVWREDGLEFVICYNDHGPPHVHVYCGEAGAVIRLGPTGPVLHAVFGMTRRDVRRATSVAHRKQALLLAAWRQIHG